MDDQVPPLYQLPLELAHHVLRHLSKREVQQFAVSCRMCVCLALAATRSLVLTHKCLTGSKAAKLRTMRYCTDVCLRPRTMDELSKMAGLLLVANMHHLPSISHLRLELLNVYDGQCDTALILKAVALHVSQLVGLHIEQEAAISLKAMATTAELPLLTHLTVRSRHGFEPGALGQLARAVNLTCLHLEVIPPEAPSSSRSAARGGGSSIPTSPTAAADGSTLSCRSKSPSELARLQASDEVALAKLGSQLGSFTAIGLGAGSGGGGGSSNSTGGTSSLNGMLRPVAALLAAVAGSHKPRLTELQLGGQEVGPTTLDLIASITSLASLALLAGCELSGSAASNLSRLSALAGLTRLQVLPLMPPSPVLAAWARGCKRLASLGLCAQPGSQPIAPPLSSVTELVLLSVSAGKSRQSSSASSSASPLGGGSLRLGEGSSSSGGTSQGSSSSGSLPSLEHECAGLAISLRSPLSLSGFELLWPQLASLEVAGWALDSASMAAIKALPGLSSIVLQGGSEPGTALHARMLLPLLNKPGLRRLVLTDVSGLDDSWVGEALRYVSSPCTDGSRAAISELHLGAAPGNGAADSPGGSEAGSTSTPWELSLSGGMGASEAGGGSSVCGVQGGTMVTDAGLARLTAWPRLRLLVLSRLPGITLGGVKALVAGSSSLAELHVLGCPAVSAAPADSISRVAVPSPGRAVDLWVK